MCDDLTMEMQLKRRDLCAESRCLFFTPLKTSRSQRLEDKITRSNWYRWPGFKGHLSQPDLHLLHRPENAREVLLEALSVNALADTNQPSFQLSFHVKLLDLDMWFLHHLSRSYHIMFHTQTQPKKLLQKLQLDTKQTDIKMLQFFFFFLFLLLSWKHIN